MKKIFKIIFAYYLVFLVWIILFKLEFDIKELEKVRYINLIPFRLGLLLNPTYNVQEVIQNVIVFLPFGMILSAIKEKKLWTVAIIAMISSVALETFQYILSIGYSDITDVLSNTFGAIVGIIIYKILDKLFREKNTFRKFLCILFVVCGLIATILAVGQTLINHKIMFYH